MFNYDNFRHNLRKQREKLGYTREVLAEKIGIDWTYLSKIELGTRIPSTTVIINLLNIFNSNLKDFLEKDSSIEELKSAEILKNIFSKNLDEADKKYLLEIIKILNKKEYTQ